MNYSRIKIVVTDRPENAALREMFAEAWNRLNQSRNYCKPEIVQGEW